jgi:hypothetical protein
MDGFTGARAGRMAVHEDRTVEYLGRDRHIEGV